MSEENTSPDETWRNADIEAWAVDRGIEVEGTKAEMLEQIAEHLAATDPTDPDADPEDAPADDESDADEDAADAPEIESVPVRRHTDAEIQAARGQLS